MAEIIKYPNGLRVVIENNPFVRSVAASIWVRTGSAMEDKSNNGISHFLEHVLFKGTDKMTAFDIANAFERKGASVNAFTSKELTCFYFKSIDSDVDSCFGVLSDIFFNSAFAQKELDSERNVVVEEINMEDDSPEDICYDLLAKALYGDHSLGMTVLGPRENVLAFNKPHLDEYIKNQYTAEGIAIVFVGNIDSRQADKIVKEHFLPFVSDKPQKSVVTKPNISVTAQTFIKDFKQSNLMFAYPSIAIGDTRTGTQAVLNTILGGCMGSRLFQNIREKKGLAYSVYSSPSRNSNSGSFNIALNINSVNTQKAINGVFEEVDLIVDKGVTADELEMAKAQLRASVTFGQENIQTIMLTLGKMLLLAGRVFDIDARLEEINAVTIDDVNAIAKETFKKKPALAYVGLDAGIDFDKVLSR